MPHVTRLREEFGIERMVMVGDRGMISQKAIDAMRQDADVAWITALRSSSIRTLVQQRHLQLGLFDERNLLEISSPDFPGERLVACRNPELAKLRGHTRDDLLAATEKSLEKIKVRVDAGKLVGKLVGKDKIGVAVGKLVNQYKVAKHFELAITDSSLSFTRMADDIAAEAALDGLCIIRTSVQAQRMDGATCVRTYKSLAQVERAFRSIKTMDLKVRPIHHHLKDRVRAHIFLRMLAYYVAWHMRQAWASLMLADEDYLAELDTQGRYLFVKLICGSFRVGVNKLLVQRALAAVSGFDSKIVAQRDDRLHRRARHEVGQPYSFFRAHALEGKVATFSERKE